MALYKYTDDLELSQSDAFDSLHEPGSNAPFPGIYVCVNCKHEVATASGHALPPQNHNQHDPNKGPIKWRLVASHKKNVVVTPKPTAKTVAAIQKLRLVAKSPPGKK